MLSPSAKRFFQCGLLIAAAEEFVTRRARLDFARPWAEDAGMVFRWVIQNWLRSMAQEKLRETVVDAAREQLSSRAAAAAAPPRPCQAGIVFALSNESGGFEDLLSDMTTLRGDGFLARAGVLERRRLVLAISGAGRARAIEATEALIAGHHPPWIISAGFCGGLSPALGRHAIVVADALIDAAGNRLDIDLSRHDPQFYSSQEGIHIGPLLQVARIVRLPSEKRTLGETHQALAADLESLAVAEVCRERNVPFLAIRVVSDTVDEKLPREVDRLLRHKSRPAQFGAALGAILDRPGSLKDMYRLHENALAASDRLAKFLHRVIQHLVPLPAEEQS